MASASSPMVRSLIRDGKSVANILFRSRTTNITATETVQNTGPAIRSLLRFNQTQVCQYPGFSEKLPVMQFGVKFIEQEPVSERIGKVKAAHEKREDAGSEEEETDFDEEEFDDLDIDDDEVFEDLDDDDDEDEDDKYTRKKKKIQ